MVWYGMVWYGIVSGMIINLKVSNDGLGCRALTLSKSNI